MFCGHAEIVLFVATVTSSCLLHVLNFRVLPFIPVNAIFTLLIVIFASLKK